MSRDYDVDLLWSDGTFSERVLVRSPSPEAAINLAARVVLQFGPEKPEVGSTVQDSDARRK